MEGKIRTVDIRQPFKQVVCGTCGTKFLARTGEAGSVDEFGVKTVT